jgi:ferredoxin
VKIVIDPVLCEGNGVCEALAPDVFAVGDDGQAYLVAGEPAETARALVRRAAEGCPRLAITVSG